MPGNSPGFSSHRIFCHETFTKLVLLEREIKSVPKRRCKLENLEAKTKSVLSREDSYLLIILILQMIKQKPGDLK